MARTPQVNITTISRRNVPGTAIEWVGSGQVIGGSSLHTRATVMLSEQGARQMQEKLVEGEPVSMPLDFEGLVELTVE
jgi:hypothetical protein